MFRAIVPIALSAALVAALFISPIAHALNTHSIDLERSSSQFLSISDASQTGLDITGDLTIEAWVKPESAPGTNEVYSIATKYETSGNQRSYLLGYTDVSGTKTLQFVADSNGGSATSGFVNQTLASGTWHHVAAVYDASAGSVEFFVNGSSIGSAGSLNTSLHSGSAPFVIGASSSGFPTVESPFDGLIDDVRVWNIARTGTEINDDKGIELNGNETGLVGYWKLNNSLSDTTANGNTLTNNNSAAFSADAAFGGFVEDLGNRKSSNESVTSSTVLQNDDALKLTLSSNKTYVIDGVIFASSTSATPDIIIAFTGQTGTTIRVGYTNDVNEMVLDSGAASSRINLPANTPTSIHIKGTVVTSSTSAGDFQLKWAQATSNAAPTTVMTGSYLRAQEI